MISHHILALLTLYTAQDSFDTEQQLLHRERLGDIVVTTNLESFEDIFLQTLCSKEDDRDVGIECTNLLSHGETIFLGHHHVEDTEVITTLQIGFISSISISVKIAEIAFGLYVLAQEHSEVLVIFAKQDAKLFWLLCHNSKVYKLHILIIFSHKRDGDDEGCALSVGGFGLDVTSMIFHNFPNISKS